MSQKAPFQDSFSYPIFCHYVICIEVLEEFALLANASAAESADHRGGSNLILDAASSALSGQRRMGTRGANRGEKSEVKSLLKRQVARCHEDIDGLMVDFITTNRDSIFQCLMIK